jgi:hypothetical protein
MPREAGAKGTPGKYRRLYGEAGAEQQAGHLTLARNDTIEQMKAHLLAP